MNAKHTPVGWYAHQGTIQGAARCLATTHGNADERNANAALMAAAPDLLEAMQDLFGADMEHVLMGDGKDDQVAAIAKAKAAIFKATGSAE